MLPSDKAKAWIPAEFMGRTKISRAKSPLSYGNGEPAVLPPLCRAAASALGVAPETLAAASTANAEEFFGLAKHREQVYPRAGV